MSKDKLDMCNVTKPSLVLTEVKSWNWPKGLSTQHCIGKTKIPFWYAITLLYWQDIICHLDKNIYIVMAQQ